MNAQRIMMLAAAAVCAALVLWLSLLSTPKPSSDAVAKTIPSAAAGSDSSPRAQPEHAPSVIDASIDLEALVDLGPDPEIAALEQAAPPTTHKVLVTATYGTSTEQLGLRSPAPGFDGDTYPPQGFARTPDGKLLVLDTAKKRLAWFDADGRMERTMPLPPELLLPADVAIAKDGSVVVVDHEGVETSGVVMLDPEGNVKARLPQMAGGLMTDMYLVGNDIFFAIEGLTAIKAGDTTGSASDETPGLFDQDGVIPGDVAPDGTTILSASIHDFAAGQLLISVLTGDPPQHVFSRLYSVGERVSQIAFSQSDARGTAYVVFYHGGQRSLLCLDIKTGDPLGHVLLPRNAGDGTPFSDYSIVESGGIIVQQLQKDGVAYHFVDCRS